MKTVYLFSLTILLSTSLLGQINTGIGINATGSSPHASAMLDISATDKGILFPRVALTSTTLSAPINVGFGPPAPYLTVFNTATINDVSPGMYYWDAILEKWVKIVGDRDAWLITGNSGTNSANHFIGTNDNVVLNFRVNSQKAGKIDHNNFNTFYGYQTANGLNEGSNNTAIGYQALLSNNGGSYNTALGSLALKDNINSVHNCAVGYNSLTVNNGGYNVAFGSGTLSSNTTGFSNTAVGNKAENMNTTGIHNVAVGHHALKDNSVGMENTAIGNFSLVTNTASGNTAIGYGSLKFNTSGSSNTVLGMSTGSSNIFGNNNTCLGASANLSVNNLSGSTALGYQAITNASNKVRIGSSTVTVVEGPVNYTVSDGRFKTGISESDVKGLEFIKRLRPVVYNFDTKKLQEFWTKDMPDSTRKIYMTNDFAPSTAIRQSGFIAQEVEQAAKEVGYNFNGVHTPENENDNYSLAYGQFVVPLVKAVQEQQTIIEKQQVIIEEQKQRLDKLEMMFKDFKK